MTDENLFKNIRNWIKEAEQNAPSNAIKVLVGNKSDREDRKVSHDEGAELAKEFNMQFFETSAKSNYNVNETFTFLTKEILNTCQVKPAQSPIKIEYVKNKTDEGDKVQCCY